MYSEVEAVEAVTNYNLTEQTVIVRNISEDGLDVSSLQGWI